MNNNQDLKFQKMKSHTEYQDFAYTFRLSPLKKEDLDDIQNWVQNKDEYSWYADYLMTARSGINTYEYDPQFSDIDEEIEKNNISGIVLNMTNDRVLETTEITITKHVDDWYRVNIIQPFKKPNQLFFRCDELEGLIQLLDRWYRNDIQ